MATPCWPLASDFVLERLSPTVDFEIFRSDLLAALGERDRRKGGRPGFDPVLKFKMLVLQAMHGLYTDAEKTAIKAGVTAKDLWPDKPRKARQKDTDAFWTVKFAKANPAEDGTKRIDKGRWACLSARSALPAPRPGSPWSI